MENEAVKNDNVQITESEPKSGPKDQKSSKDASSSKKGSKSPQSPSGSSITAWDNQRFQKKLKALEQRNRELSSFKEKRDRGSTMRLHLGNLLEDPPKKAFEPHIVRNVRDTEVGKGEFLSRTIPIGPSQLDPRIGVLAGIIEALIGPIIALSQGEDIQHQGVLHENGPDGKPVPVKDSEGNPALKDSILMRASRNITRLLRSPQYSWLAESLDKYLTDHELTHLVSDAVSTGIIRPISKEEIEKGLTYTPLEGEVFSSQTGRRLKK